MKQLWRISKMTMKNILLVDDSKTDREVMLAMLKDQSQEVTVLKDGIEALDYLYRRGTYSERTDDDPTVILLDVLMPTIDGISVLIQAKADPRLKDIPIIMLSRWHDQHNEEESKRFGAAAYLLKPTTLQTLIDVKKQLNNIFQNTLS